LFAFIVSRLLQALPVMLVVALISFAMFAYVGDPVAIMLGQDFTEAQREALVRDLGLDQPFFVQFARFAGNAAQGEFGLSYRLSRPVAELIAERAPATLELALCAAAMSLLVGVPMGVFTGLYRRSWLSRFFLTFSLIGVSLPTFLIGILLILVFSVWLGWLPAGGRQTVSLTGETSLWDRIQHLILPVAVLSFGPIAFFSRIMRTETLEVIHTDYVRTARAKGLSSNQVWFVHALRNALIPLMTVMGPAIVGVLAGAVVTETIFAWPGMGRLTINAVFQQDYPLVLGAGMFFAVLTIIGYLLSDIFYALVDPRVRLQ
jgi:peptide/nickel transport system permease protein